MLIANFISYLLILCNTFNAKNLMLCFCFRLLLKSSTKSARRKDKWNFIRKYKTEFSDQSIWKSYNEDHIIIIITQSTFANMFCNSDSLVVSIPTILQLMLRKMDSVCWTYICKTWQHGIILKEIQHLKQAMKTSKFFHIISLTFADEHFMLKRANTYFKIILLAQNGHC